MLKGPDRFWPAWRSRESPRLLTQGSAYVCAVGRGTGSLADTRLRAHLRVLPFSSVLHRRRGAQQLRAAGGRGGDGGDSAGSARRSGSREASSCAAAAARPAGGDRMRPEPRSRNLQTLSLPPSDGITPASPLRPLQAVPVAPLFSSSSSSPSSRHRRPSIPSYSLPRPPVRQPGPSTGRQRTPHSPHAARGGPAAPRTPAALQCPLLAQAAARSLVCCLLFLLFPFFFFLLSSSIPSSSGVAHQKGGQLKADNINCSWGRGSRQGTGNKNRVKKCWGNIWKVWTRYGRFLVTLESVEATHISISNQHFA